MKRILIFITPVLFATSLYGQSPTGKSKSKELVLLAGTIQPFLLQGANFEVDLYTQKFVFNYSHGLSLDMNSKSKTTVGKFKEQSLALHLPFSTGFGVGYRMNKYFDVRLEPKLHKFEVYYDGTNRKLAENHIRSYRTGTLGVGAYFRWSPFENNKSFLKGITTSTSVRYWQNVWSSLNDNRMDYNNKVTGTSESLKAANIGVANSPLIFNIAIGYRITI